MNLSGTFNWLLEGQESRQEKQNKMEPLVETGLSPFDH